MTDFDLATLITTAVDRSDAPVRVKDLVVQHGEKGAESGPPWYECLVQMPDGSTTTVKESTAYDSFMSWVGPEALKMVAEQFPDAEIPTATEFGLALQQLLDEIARKGGADDCYGVDLARLVADTLEQGSNLAYEHRDYCGIGLSFDTAKGFLMGEVNDGYPVGFQGSDLGVQNIWHNKGEFVQWLSLQSDYSLSGYALTNPEGCAWIQGNQRITRERLEEFVGSSAGR
mmetsp:Transcript_20314/g.63686  ORF Transcript_20314/g.63686 Transcript_20314/m.63686 type:complete len:229 (-) Transcript_20314:96-782(-)